MAMTIASVVNSDPAAEQLEIFKKEHGVNNSIFIMLYLTNKILLNVLSLNSSGFQKFNKNELNQYSLFHLISSIFFSESDWCYND